MSLSTATWPVNLGAYRRVAPAPLSTIAAVFLYVAGNYDPATIAAAVVAVASDLGVLLARDGLTGWKRHAKTLVSVLSTVLVALLLALGAVEGADGTTMTLGSVLLQLDSSDWFAIGLMVVKTLAQTFIPNAHARFDENALGEHVDISAEALPAAAPYIPAQNSAALLGDERTPTTALSVLTPEVIAADAAERNGGDHSRRERRATQVAAAPELVPVPAPLPHDVVDLDAGLGQEATTSSNPLMRTIGGPL